MTCGLVLRLTAPVARQIHLFEAEESAPLAIVSDGSGRIVYYPAIFSLDDSALIFNQLSARTLWNHETMRMYDRLVAVPRLTAAYRDMQALPEVLRLVKERVECSVGFKFNAVSLNYYRDGQDSVAWHNDHPDELVERGAVALASFGATRQILLRTKSRPRKVLACDLEPGSVMMMSGATQQFWDHHVPKVRRPTAARISVALRQRPTD